jgi:hypothetical protein
MLRCVFCGHEGGEVILQPGDSQNPIASCWNPVRCANRVARANARAEAQTDRHCPICGRRTTLPIASNPATPGREIHRCPENVLRAIDGALGSDGPAARALTEGERLAKGFAMLGASEATCEFSD